MKRHYLSLILTFLAASAFAQFNATITVTEFGTGAPVQNASVLLDGNTQSTDVAGQTVFTGLADGTYDYSVSLACYNTGSGSITIAGADASSALELEADTTNNVFFFIGSPMAIIGATVQLWDDAGFFVSFVTSDPWGGEMVADVPYGEYSFAIVIPCYETTSGTITVDCNNGEGIAVFAEPGEANNVFFYIGSPFAIIGATVVLTDGADFNVSFVTWDTWGGEMVESVPFGDYTYTITAPCYEPVTGTVTVHCNNGEGIVVVAEPVAIDIDATVTLDGSVLTVAATGAVYVWVDCNNGNAIVPGAFGQSFAPTQNGNYAVLVTVDDCWELSSCTEVTVTGTEEMEGGDVFTVYPNPFSETLTVRTNEEAGTTRVQLFSTTGQLVLDETSSGMALITMHTAHIPSGSYMLRVTTNKASATSVVVR